MPLPDPTEILDTLLPKDENNPASVKRHRLRVALVACASFMSLLFVVFPSLFVGLPQLGKVAWADEVDDKIAQVVEPIRRDVEVIKSAVGEAKQESLRTRIWLLGNEVFKARQEQCNAIKAGSGARFWTERLLELKSEYEALAGRTYDVPSCEEL